ncbi:MAG TPA: acyl-CoA dehydrogenase [Acidimicrobiales bacterium]|nr:acyl-CoA dehydrogenase [Acidimicrobiales bacterium]
MSVRIRENHIEMHHRQLRYCDAALSPEQEIVAELVEGFLAGNAPLTVARHAPSGFDANLWRAISPLGLVSMALPKSAGGDDGGPVEMCVVAERCGRHLAPIPFAETVVAARLAASAGADDLVKEIVNGMVVASLAPAPAVAGRALVPAGAIATAVFALVGDELVLGVRRDPPGAVANLGDTPLAWWSFEEDLDSRVVLDHGAKARALMDRARREWKLCMAAMLLGLATGALDQGVQHAKSREAFGVPVGYFQSVAHPLVDVAIAIDGLAALIGKAAWFEQEEPQQRRELVDMALVHASETANEAATCAVHTLGGVGFTLESDAHLFFRRAKGWALLAGTKDSCLAEIATELFGATL